jgi:hypothetical protein
LVAGRPLRGDDRFVVLIDPGTPTVSTYHGTEQTILRRGDTLTLPDVLPGLSVAVDRLFA